MFSDTEKEIIRLVCEEKTSEEISNQLYMSKRTVEKYRARILRKMKVKTSAGVLKYAIKNFLYHLTE